MLYELLIVSVPLTRFCDKRDIEGPTSAYSRIGKFAQHTTVRIGDASAERRYNEQLRGHRHLRPVLQQTSPT
jgi:hypothetical protein